MTPTEIAAECVERFGTSQPIDLEPIYCMRCGREIDDRDIEDFDYVSISAGEWAHASCQKAFEDRYPVHHRTLSQIVVQARIDAKCL